MNGTRLASLEEKSTHSEDDHEHVHEGVSTGCCGSGPGLDDTFVLQCRVLRSPTLICWDLFANRFSWAKSCTVDPADKPIVLFDRGMMSDRSRGDH